MLFSVVKFVMCVCYVFVAVFFRYVFDKRLPFTVMCFVMCAGVRYSISITEVNYGICVCGLCIDDLCEMENLPKIRKNVLLCDCYVRI